MGDVANTCLLVDLNDRVVDTKDIREAHKSFLCHRSFELFAVDQDFNVLVQLRSARKDRAPFVWSGTCSGHYSEAEGPMEDQVKQSLAREWGWELDQGINRIAKVYYQDVNHCEHELVHLYVCMLAQRPSELSPNKKDIFAHRWVPISEAQELSAWLQQTLNVLFKREEGKLTVKEASETVIPLFMQLSQAPPALPVDVLGVSAAIPDKERKVFSEDPLAAFAEDRIRVQEVPEETREAVKKESGLSTAPKFYGRLNGFDPADYPQWITKIIENTTTESDQLGIVAGMKAVEDAGMLQMDHSRTGVIFATSFAFKETNPSIVSSRRKVISDLVHADYHIASILQAKGPTMSLQSACSTTGSAVIQAHEWLANGRCDHVVIAIVDLPTSDDLFPRVGGGFHALGAITMKDTAEEALQQFGEGRSGILLSSGAMGFVYGRRDAPRPIGVRKPYCSFVGGFMANHAKHPLQMDGEMMEVCLRRFISRLPVTAEELAEDCVYYSHETGTYVNGGCSRAEMTVLRHVMGPESVKKMIVANTKCFTGHPLACSFEHLGAIMSLSRGDICPLGKHIHVAKEFDDIHFMREPTRIAGLKYAMVFSAGFGSHLNYGLYVSADKDE